MPNFVTERRICNALIAALLDRHDRHEFERKDRRDATGRANRSFPRVWVRM